MSLRLAGRMHWTWVAKSPPRRKRRRGDTELVKLWAKQLKVFRQDVLDLGGHPEERCDTE